ncbi:Pectin lyase-like superfamily protein [Perilla frutescens var. hirtella]|nr:Pectin lyase-like superfamily protein [Perilla frutescens var. hirtella]
MRRVNTHMRGSLFMSEVSLTHINVIDSQILTTNIRSNRTIIVDANGEGDFKSVQAAIDHVPNRNSKWIMIHISKGVYREKVKIPHNKPYIFMRGEGKGKTLIVWSRSSADEYESATFKVEAKNFIAFGITFKNTAPSSISHTQQNKAVATVVGADKAAFYNCAFISNHNTLFDSRGRHYYGGCYIQGSIDLIFGHGQSMFYDCEVFVVPNLKSEIGGSIAASHRHRSNASSGFVFVKSKVYGVGNVYLGRAKGTHSRVVFADSYLSNSVISHGWTDWSYPGSKENLHLAEYNCHGPGSASKNRADWSKQLSFEEAIHLITIDFIKGREWLPAWL